MGLEFGMCWFVSLLTMFGIIPVVNLYVLIFIFLTHLGRVTHICVDNLTIIGPDNDLSPGRRQAIIWTNAGILLIGPWGTNFSEILIGIHTFSFNKIHLKMSSAKWRLFCLGLNVLMNQLNFDHAHAVAWYHGLFLFELCDK